ncbi:hypothetical protein [Rhodohalobacter sp.]|uniref:hypothetical protein n=1 Tax=Rhodohalobacter sp. TaxID=1974210 RepID=UPI002ACD60A8|nr:hypothetical protein [Rhodohalobacter sp.]MDZ7757225.1 hypothetical protein [Rhodohalobacter sp.]
MGHRRSKIKEVTDKDTLKARMKRDKYFEERHFRKVDVAFEIYTEEMDKLKQEKLSQSPGNTARIQWPVTLKKNLGKTARRI